MSAVTLRRLAKSFGSTAVIAPLDLEVAPGSFVSIIGPSGCGKSTLLRVVAGLEPATSGLVEVHGEPPRSARAGKRVAIVPQQPGLLPWRTVIGNARLLLDVNRRSSVEQRATDDLAGLLDVVGLGDVHALYPHQLSGGMQQRVALVRALALGAPLLLMDEPFAALDEITRADMRSLLLRLVEGADVTTLFVTHSIAEAVALSDRVLVVSPRPMSVVADLAIDLARPRSADVEDDVRFVALCADVRHALRLGMAA